MLKERQIVLAVADGDDGFMRQLQHVEQRRQSVAFACRWVEVFQKIRCGSSDDEARLQRWGDDTPQVAELFMRPHEQNLGGRRQIVRQQRGDRRYLLLT